MEAAPLQRAVHAADLPLDKLAGNPQLSQHDKLSEVSRQFEAVLLRQILQESQKTVFHSKLTPSSTANGIYQDLITDQLAEGISKAGAFGVAQSLRQQLDRQAPHPLDPAAGHSPTQPAGPARP